MLRPSFRRLLTLGLLAPWLTTGCGSDGKSSDDAPPTGESPSGETPQDPATLPPFARDMLAAHNSVRAGVTPAANPALEPLGWDAAAEAKAQAWAANCDFKHNPNRGDLGENLAAATPNHWDTPGVVEEWASEAADYDYARNTCASGKVCGHYTQVVWRATKRVGCATQVCNKNSPFGAQYPTWQFWVCNYAPPGNYAGQRPY
ncbi:CAP domain-containing protein [Myxococcus sp. RHSTA-1-4]|uniref:CAP domain-containing protein n=1 Tax=Myxococcus sp. RHSTA-1-4 TaxID=2874601 RepID=UPI001CBE660B|nr:CAP domain-containing protein [Myxococcus sp. RHSTA-1-4]MBZ4420544.1 hypothetical protein [Myxococcus sp. RHSTA-1-4]